MDLAYERLESLGAYRNDVEELLSRIADADGIDPFDEQARLNLGRESGSHYVLALDLSKRDGQVDPRLEGPRPVGIAAADLRAGSIELTVDPAFRGMGIGSRLLEEIRGAVDGRFTVWAHGSSMASEALAARMSLTKVRELLVMTRNLVNLESEPVDLGDGVTIDTFSANKDSTTDLDDLVALNATAFADHPEQGQLDSADFEERFGQAWFDPDLLWIVRSDGEPAAFVWLKPQSDTSVELYVLGVHPEMQGRGLGGKLSTFMLGKMVERGYRDAILYVEAENEAAVRAYRRVGFEVSERHVAYELPE